VQLLKLLSKVKEDEIKERFIQGSFIAWQMGAGAGKKFGEYLRELGLQEGQAETMPPAQDLTKEQAIAKAEEILRMAREKGKKGLDLSLP